MGFRAEIILRIQSIIFSCEAASRAAVRGRSVVERAGVDPIVDHEQLFDGQRRFVFWHDGQVEHLKHRRVFGITRTDVCAGDAENSPMFQVLNLAIMPKDKPPLTIEQLFMIYDWINAGALDN